METHHMFGVLAAAAHLIAYLWYAVSIMRQNTVPHAATWFMWLIGAFVEYTTYSDIEGGHWSANALPLICVVGVCLVFVVTAGCQLYDWHRYGNKAKARYHKPERGDYYLTAFDVLAGSGWLFNLISATVANVIAVGSTVLNYIPTWRTMRTKGGEQPGPWALWCIAYVAMISSVVIEGGVDLEERLFYPVYYFTLSAITGILAWRYKDL